jgi:hypothetical protein
VREQAAQKIVVGGTVALYGLGAIALSALARSPTGLVRGLSGLATAVGGDYFVAGGRQDDLSRESTDGFGTKVAPLTCQMLRVLSPQEDLSGEDPKPVR